MLDQKVIELKKKYESAVYQWEQAIKNWHSLTNDEQGFFVDQMQLASKNYSDYTGEIIF